MDCCDGSDALFCISCLKRYREKKKGIWHLKKIKYGYFRHLKSFIKGTQVFPVLLSCSAFKKKHLSSASSKTTTNAFGSHSKCFWNFCQTPFLKDKRVFTHLEALFAAQKHPKRALRACLGLLLPEALMPIVLMT